MIVRILGEGQYELPDDALDGLHVLDDRLQAAVDAADKEAFTAALARLLAAVHAASTAMPDEALTSSELVLPGPDSDIGEVAALLGGEGLIPG